jgi:nucleotide-binding universal stress UspA family protein
MKILVGIDGTSHGYDTLVYAIGEAKLKGAELTAILSRAEEETGENAIRDEEIVETARKKMQDEGMPPDVHLLVCGNRPGVDIVRFAEENSYGHTIVGSHHMSRITRILDIGTVADEVVHKAHCSVTVFRR